MPEEDYRWRRCFEHLPIENYVGAEAAWQKNLAQR